MKKGFKDNFGAAQNTGEIIDAFNGEEMPTLFRKEYPRKSRAIELLFIILFFVLLIPIASILVTVLMGRVFEPLVELYIDIVWTPFRKLHNKINPHKETDMATLTKKERAWLNELQDVLDRCPSPKKIGFYTIGDKSIYLYDLRRMDEIMEALDNRSSMDWCVAVHDMNAGFDEKILFPSSVESTAG